MPRPGVVDFLEGVGREAISRVGGIGGALSGLRFGDPRPVLQEAGEVLLYGQPPSLPAVEEVLAHKRRYGQREKGPQPTTATQTYVRGVPRTETFRRWGGVPVTSYEEVSRPSTEEILLALEEASPPRDLPALTMEPVSIGPPSYGRRPGGGRGEREQLQYYQELLDQIARARVVAGR